MPRKTLLPWFIVAIALFASACFELRWTSSDLSPLEALTQNFERVPIEVEGWDCKAAEASNDEFEYPHFTARDSRTFFRGDKKVGVYAVCGTARHMTIESPSYGYDSVGFRLEAPPKLRSISLRDDTAEFATANYKQTHPRLERAPS